MLLIAERILLRLACEPRAYYMAYMLSVVCLILTGTSIGEDAQCSLLAAFAAAAVSF